MGAGVAIGPMLLKALPAMAVSAAGAIYNNNIQNQAIRRQNTENQRAMMMAQQAREAESQRQLAMEADQRAAVRTATEASDPGELRKEVEAYAEAPNEFTESATAYNLDRLPGQTTSGEMSETIGKTVGEAIQRTREILRSQSMLSKQGTGFAGMGDAALRMQDDVSNIGSFRRRSAAVGNMEANIQPAKVTPSDSILGDILLASGQMLAGGMGASAAGGKAAAGAVGQPLNAIPWLGPVNAGPFGAPLI